MRRLERLTPKHEPTCASWRMEDGKLLPCDCKTCEARFLWPDHGHHHMYFCEQPDGHELPHRQGNFVWGLANPADPNS